MNVDIILIKFVIFFFIIWIGEVFMFFFPGMFIFNFGYPVIANILFITESSFTNGFKICFVCIVS